MTIEQWPEAPGPLYTGLDLVRNQALRSPTRPLDDEPDEDDDRDTADEHGYGHELWADADASREGEGL